jgi:uncharacterized membrane protein
MADTEHVTKTIRVNSSIDEVYGIWSNFENFPYFMDNITEVKRSNGHSHWVMEVLGQKVEWDAETTRMEENREIAWNSTGGDIETSGRVLFREIAPDETEVELSMAYVPPNVIAKVFANPEGRLEKDLQNFKAYAEGRKGGAEELKG